MFDIGWSELLVIAVVAIVVIGPKDLPAALRGLGKTIRTVRRMASEFQDQFNEALKEAELDGLRKEVADLRRAAQDMVRVPDVREEIRSAIENSGQPNSAATTESALPPPDTQPTALGETTRAAETHASEAHTAAEQYGPPAAPLALVPEPLASSPAGTADLASHNEPAAPAGAAPIPAESIPADPAGRHDAAAAATPEPAPPATDRGALETASAPRGRAP